ncbi:MAG: lipopolysaccharide biosynthesis protein RfbH [Lachnospiraceae bacterium]
MMFENKTETEVRSELLAMVEEYTRRFHNVEAPFHEGDAIPYAARVYDESEVRNLVDSSLEFWLTSGRYTKQFETELAAYLGVRYCSLVNSGSSANLLAFMALTSPLLEEERRIRRGDEVITVAAAFPTTIAPILQFGAVPVFVDVTIPQYNLDVTKLEAALSPKTKAVFIAHTLGNPADIRSIRSFCDTHGLWFIEDNCDALGSEYHLHETSGRTGSFGDIGTSSFYPPHHMTMGEGGAVYTNDPLLHKIIRSLRDWGRDCICDSGRDNLCGHRFDRQYGELPFGYDHKYVYSHFGYNLKATDLQAAIGVAQLSKLSGFTEKRRSNHAYFRKRLAACEESLILPEACPGAVPSWFGFLMTCHGNTDKNTVVNFLENRGIQTRALFAGNIIRHPCFDELRREGTGYRVAGELTETDRIMRDTFWVGVYPGLSEQKREYIADSIMEAVTYEGQ